MKSCCQVITSCFILDITRCHSREDMISCTYVRQAHRTAFFRQSDIFFPSIFLEQKTFPKYWFLHILLFAIKFRIICMFTKIQTISLIQPLTRAKSSIFFNIEPQYQEIFLTGSTFSLKSVKFRLLNNTKQTDTKSCIVYILCTIQIFTSPETVPWLLQLYSERAP